MRLEAKKRKFMMARRYDRAEKIEGRVREVREALHRRELNRMVEEQRRERRTASQLHGRQMGQLEKLWGDYFRRLRRRERDIIRQFETEERQKIEKEKGTLRRRCHSVRVNRSASL